MSTISYRHSIAALCCALPMIATAQTPHSVTRLDSIVVTPARGAQLLNEVVGDVTVIDREELDRAGQTSVAEILAKQPGIQFSSMGGPQTQTSVFLRGANAPHTLVLVDGVRINLPASGGANWNTLDPSLIERIEIVRGSASSLYGSSAIGGVINIITRKSGEDRPLSAWGNIGYGTHDTFRSSAGISGAHNGWDYAFSGFVADSAGFNATRRTPDPYSPYNPDVDGYESHGFSGSLGYQWQPGHHVGVSFMNSYVNGQYDSGAVIDPRTLTRQQTYAITSTNQLSAFWQSTLRYAFTKESSDSRDFNDSKAGALQRSWSWQNDFNIGTDHTVSALFERLEERMQSTQPYDVDARNTNSVALIYRGKFFDRLRTQASIRNDNISAYGNEQTGSLGLDYDITDNWSVGVGGSTGFRTPTFNDLYGPWGNNPDLKPEKSRNIEAHISFDNGTTRADLTVYQNKIRDLITYNPQLWYSENIDKATIRGLTVAGSHTVGNTVLSASADFMNPKNDTTGELLPRRAKQVYHLGINHRINAWDLGAEYQFVGKRIDTAAPTSDRWLGGYSLFNLTAAYDFSKNVGVQVRWNNIFDKDYTNAYGYNMPGSNIFVNLSFRM